MMGWCRINKPVKFYIKKFLRKTKQIIKNDMLTSFICIKFVKKVLNIYFFLEYKMNGFLVRIQISQTSINKIMDKSSFFYMN